jgi:hypothetical protein
MFACADCFTSPTLVALIKEIGTPGDCDLCKRTSVVCVRDAQLIPSIKPLLDVYGRPGDRN